MKNYDVAQYDLVVPPDADPIKRVIEYERVADVREDHGYWGSATSFRGAAAKLRLLRDYDPTDEPADLVLCTVRDSDRTTRCHYALLLRAMFGDLDTCEMEDLL